MSADPTELRLPPIQIGRRPRTDDELYELVWTLWGVRVPRHKVCDDHVAPFTAFADAFFGRSPWSVWKASRGFGGKSRTLSYLVLTEAVVLGADVNILGGSGAQSQNIHEAMREGWDHPLAPIGLAEHLTSLETRLKNGARVRALTASQRSVRGPHPQRLRLDEIDEMDIEILDAAMGQPMPGKGIETQTVMSSTHQYLDGTMTAIIERAEKNDIPVFEWCWRETSNPHDGWLAASTVERKRREVTAEMWAIEYDLQEPSSEARAFDEAAVDTTFDAELGEYPPPTREGAAEDLEFERPDPRAKYVTAADWAKEKDHTVILTYRVDQKPWRLVAYYRGNRRSWPEMVAKFEQRRARYRGQAIHDATGLGGVVADMLSGKVRDQILAGRQRDDILSEYAAAVEQGEFEAPLIHTMYRDHRYATQGDLYGRGTKHHCPDSIIAAALAWSMRPKAVTTVRPSPGFGRRPSPWRTSGT